MNFKMMGRFYALILGIEGFFMLPALGISIYDGTLRVTLAFAVTVAITALLVTWLALWTRGAPKDFFEKEGLVCVGSSWILMSVIGCLPFVISQEIPDFLDALFETVSGFTTTGSSILSDVESLSRGILYWRSFSHWLGGMGVLVFLLAIIPVGGRNEGFTMHLFRAESPGPDVGKLVPKLRQTAAALYGTYVALTVADFLFLRFGGMPLFDSVCTALGTAGTGGFGIKNDSMASYSPYLQNVTTVFMLLFGINFSCYYLLLIRQFKAVIRDEELRFYLCFVAGSIAVISLNLFFGTDFYTSFQDALRDSSFQVASLVSTTGFATANFDLWPTLSKTILIFLMITGACAGSTCGGFKCARILILFKGIKRNITQVVHPQKVQVIRVNGKPLDEKILASTNAYLATYLVLLLLSFLLISVDGQSMTTGLTAVLACLNNIGPGLDAVGPTCNFALFSPLSKVVLIFDMLAGRLEIFPILVLFSAWKKHV